MKPSSTLLKEEFLNKWLASLQEWSSSSKEMSLKERKEAIKLSADLAMASTRNHSTLWSRALIANASKDSDNEGFPIQPTMNNPNDEHKTKRTIRTTTMSSSWRKKTRSRNGRKRRCSVLRRSRRCEASEVAERLVRNRTQALKELVPGGECMDESVLLKEALDYMFSLRAQVHVMQTLVDAADQIVSQI